MSRPVAHELPLQDIDPADPRAEFSRDQDVREGAARYARWAREERAREAEAQRFRASAGRPRYRSTYGEPLWGGPSPVPGRPRRAC